MRTLICATAALLLLAGGFDTAMARGTPSEDPAKTTPTDTGEVSVYDFIRQNDNNAFDTGVVAGIYIGMSWANDMLKRGRKEQPLFCQPDADANSMTPKQLRNILDTYIGAHPESGKLRSDYIGFILLSAMVEKFPCKH
jgi:hypothetical protein